MLTENSYNEFMDNFVEVFEEGDDFMDLDDNDGFDDDELLNGNFSLDDEEDDFSDDEEDDFSDDEEDDFSYDESDED